MNKLQMAHEHAMKCIGNPNVSVKTNNEIISFAWQYAEAMQAEADKRVVKFPDVFFDTKPNEKWQPDWNQAPAWANWWAMDGFSKKANWYTDKPYLDDDSEVESEWNIDLKTNTETYMHAPSFEYQGNWKESLRKRL